MSSTTNAYDLVICEFLDETALQGIPGTLRYHYDPTLVEKPQELRALISDVPGLIVRSYIKVDEAFLRHGPKLKVIGRLGVGLDNFDLEACARRNVKVLNAAGGNADSVGEYAVVMALTLMRNAYNATNSVITGEWPRNALVGTEAKGKAFGIVGLGNTGRASARRARALDMSVIACDPYVDAEDPAWTGVERADLDDVLAKCDALSLHVPLTGETHYMIDKGAIDQMKPGACLINAARGGVVDEAALVAALRSGHLAGAAVDVFEHEPLDAEHGKQFAGLQNVILTPHIAGVTHESNLRISEITVANVVNALV